MITTQDRCNFSFNSGRSWYTQGTADFFSFAVVSDADAHLEGVIGKREGGHDLFISEAAWEGPDLIPFAVVQLGDLVPPAGAGWVRW